MHYIPGYYRQEPADFKKVKTQLDQNTPEQTL